MTYGINGSQDKIHSRSNREVAGSKHGDSMKPDVTLELLPEYTTMLAERFGVISLAPLGLIARAQEAYSIDVDILVSCDGPATFKRYFESLLGLRVDLLIFKALHSEFRPCVEAEAVEV